MIRRPAITLAILFLVACASRGQKAPPPPTTEPTELDRVLELVKADPAVKASTATSASELGELIYAAIYEPPSATLKPATITEEDLRAKFLAYERSQQFGPWLVRVGMTGQNEAAPENMVRIYLNLLPDGAMRLVEAFTADMNEKKLKFTLKMAATFSEFRRSSTATIYLSRTDYPLAKASLLDLAKSHADAFTDPVAPLSKRLALGISAADEPDLSKAPKTRPQHSFGSFVSDVIAEAWLAHPGADLNTKVKEQFRSYGADPDRLYLRPGHSDDDL